MATKDTKRSTLATLLVGALLGLFVHIVVYSTAVLFTIIVRGGLSDPGFGEAVMWNLVIAVGTSPAGLFVGVLTALGSRVESLSWLQTTVLGTIPTMLAAGAVWLVFAVILEQPDPALSIIMLLTGSSIAGVVAAASGKTLPVRGKA